MFRFGFKKKWKNSTDPKHHEEPKTSNGIKLLTYRPIDNEFAPKTPMPEIRVPRRPRVKRNVLEVFRQSYPNYGASSRQSEPVHFESVQPRNEPVSNQSEPTNSLEKEEKSTLIFMTEDHDDIVIRSRIESENEPIAEDFNVNLGTAFEQRRMQFAETVSSVEQEQEMQDFNDVRELPVHEEVNTERESNSGKDSIEDRETVDLEDANSELGEDHFRVHVFQPAIDATSMVSHESGDFLDSESMLQDDRPQFRFDDNYNFGETQTEDIDEIEEIQRTQERNDIYKSESEDDTSPQIDVINNNIKLVEQHSELEEPVENQTIQQVEKRVMFDVPDNDEITYKSRVQSEIITTPKRKETLEDVKMKDGYSLQASALFFSGADDNGNDSETSA